MRLRTIAALKSDSPRQAKDTRSQSIRKSPRKRSRPNQMAVAVMKLAESHEKYGEVKKLMKETPAQQAIKTFLKDYSHVSKTEKMKLVRHFTKNSDEAEMFNVLDKETQDAFVEEFIDSLDD